MHKFTAQYFNSSGYPTASLPTGVAGDLSYDTTTNTYKFFNGTAWGAFSTDLSGYVPYTGATGDVDLGDSYGVSANYFYLQGTDPGLSWLHGGLQTSYTSGGSAWHGSAMLSYGANSITLGSGSAPEDSVFIMTGAVGFINAPSAPNYTSTVATGTAPYAATSTTLNTNLNADLLDGNHAAAFQPAGSYLTSEADTLATVVARGNTAASDITIHGENIGTNGRTYSTLFGAMAQRDVTTGDFNVSVGQFSLFGNTDGSYNVAIGRRAGGIATGNYPVTSLNNSTVIGGWTQVKNTTGDTNEIVIGYGATGDGSNTTVIGSPDIISTRLRGTVYGNIFNSTVSTGTAPLTIASTTAVTNLNADLLDGNHAAAFQPAGSYLTSLCGAVLVDQSTPQTIINGAPLFNVGLKSPKLYPSADGTSAVQILKADGTSSVIQVDTTNSSVGIGPGTAASPVVNLVVSEVGSVAKTAGWFSSTSTATSGIIGGFSGLANYTGTATRIGDIIGFWGQASASSNTGTKTIPKILGVFGSALIIGDNDTVSSLIGSEYQTGFGGGMGATNVTDAIAIHAKPLSDGTASAGNIFVTNNYGLKVDPLVVQNMSLTNNYGVYVDDQSSLPTGTTVSGNNFNIYSAGSGKNYFGGKVGIGTTIPGKSLDIVGDFALGAEGGGAIAITPIAGGVQFWTNNAYSRASPGSGWTTGTSMTAGLLNTPTLAATTANITTTNSDLFVLPVTSASTGQLRVGTDVVFHTYNAVANNLFVGWRAGNFTLTGALGRNTGIGPMSLSALTSGDANSALGYYSLRKVTSGSYNVGIGTYAGDSITTGSSNLAVGANTLYGNGTGALTGSNNVSIGVNSSFKATGAAGSNTVVGFQAGHEFTTASGNVFIGTQAGYYETGSNKLFIDNAARASEADARTKALIYGVFDASTANQALTVNGSLGIGIAPTNIFHASGAPATGVPTARIANTLGGITQNNGLLILAGNDTGVAASELITFQRPDSTIIGSISQTAAAAVAYNSGSDRRIKENIVPTTYGLSDLLKINVTDFNFISDINKQKTTGFIAQDLNNIYPGAVTTNGDNGTDPLAIGKTPWMIDYGRLTPLLVKSVQDLDLNLEGIAGIVTPLSGSPSESFVTAFFNNIKTTIGTWLADASNGVTKIFTGEIDTKSLCVSDETGAKTCITKEQLDALIVGAGSTGGGGGSVPPIVPVCTAPQILVDNVCADPAPVVPVCTAPQTLVNNVCMDPTPAEPAI